MTGRRKGGALTPQRIAIAYTLERGIARGELPSEIFKDLGHDWDVHPDTVRDIARRMLAQYDAQGYADLARCVRIDVDYDAIVANIDRDGEIA